MYTAFADKDLVTAETRWAFNKNRGDEMNADSHNGVLNLLQLLRLNPPDKMLVTVGTMTLCTKL